MKETPYIWHNGSQIDWSNAHTHILTHALHYGSGVFEGIRFYETDYGPAIFRLPEHIDRLLYSASVFGMEVPYSRDDLIEATVETVASSGEMSRYIRPIIFYGYGHMGLSSLEQSEINASIAVWPWGSYLGEEAVRVKTSQFIRIHPQSTVTDAKVCGHYVNSILANQDVVKDGYDEALLLDHEGFVAEGPGENIFTVSGKTLRTPRRGTILPGITRATIIELAEASGYEVEETQLTLEDCYGADALFFTGTAAEVTPIATLDEHTFESAENEIVADLKETYTDLVRGKVPARNEWLTFATS